MRNKNLSRLGAVLMAFMLFSLFVVFVLPSPVQAANLSSTSSTEFLTADCSRTGSIAKCVKGIYLMSLGLGALIALLMIVLSGYRYMTASGNAQQVENAKGAFTDAFIGLIIIFVAFILLYIINPDLTKFKDLSLPKIPAPITSSTGTGGQGAVCTSDTGCNSGFACNQTTGNACACTNATLRPGDCQARAGANTVATPTIETNPPTGLFKNQVVVTLKTDTAGADIYYTDNNTAPVRAFSKLYTNPLTYTSNTKIRVKAFKTGMTPSAEAVGDLAFDGGGNPGGLSCNITADPAVITTSGQSSTLTWSSTGGATEASLQSDEPNSSPQSVPVNGNQQVTPAQTATYQLTVKNSTGSSQLCSANVSVNVTIRITINNFQTLYQVGDFVAITFSAIPNRSYNWVLLNVPGGDYPSDVRWDAASQTFTGWLQPGSNGRYPLTIEARLNGQTVASEPFLIIVETPLNP